MSNYIMKRIKFNERELVKKIILNKPNKFIFWTTLIVMIPNTICIFFFIVLNLEIRDIY